MPGDNRHEYPTYVSDVQRSEVMLENVSEDLREALQQLGAEETEGPRQKTWVIYASDKEKLAKTFAAIRDLGIPFAGGPSGWPPAEIFRELRDQDLIEGEFKEITWLGKGQWEIRTDTHAN